MRVFDNAGPVLCEPCFEAVAHEESNERHKFISFQYTIASDQEDEKYMAAKCVDCGQG